VQSGGYYLGVSHSASGKAWRSRLDDNARRTALHIAQKYNLPEILADVLAGRGIAAEDASAFLNPSLKQLMPDPDIMFGMKEAAARLAQACLRHEEIAVFADYDVDGACCAALLSRYLTALGCPPRLYIPNRQLEGYGPNKAAMRLLAEEGASLIITADCGANSSDALAEAKQAGADILVLDHHQTTDLGALPADYIQVNPNQPHDTSGLGYLCATGVVYMFLVAVNRLLRQGGIKELPDLLSLLDLVALATICDIVPLIGLNRAFVRQGLKVAQGQTNLGLKALTEAARLAEPINSYHCGFILGSRINAGGRIGDSSLGAKLLITESAGEAEQIAKQLDGLNYGRQDIETEQLQEALSQIEADIARNADCPMAFAAGDWHKGVVGLIAARLKERFEKPAFVMSLTDKNGEAAGSARSVTGLDIGRLIAQAAENGVLARGGGHKMAAGFSLTAEKIPQFRAWLEQYLAEDSQFQQNQSETSCIEIDGSLSAGGATAELAEDLEKAGPFGAGNPQPVFAFPKHKLVYAQPMGKDGAHLRLTIEDRQGNRLQAVAFRTFGTDLDSFLRNHIGKNIHIIGNLSVNHWNGRNAPQLHLVDAAEVIAAQ